MKESAASSKRPRVMVFGTFDLLHPGHEFLLSEAGKRGAVTVIVARDSNVKRIKGKPPKENEVHRMEAIHRKFQDFHVQLGDSENFLVPLREVQPDLVLLGYDQILPPGVNPEDFPCPVERLKSFQPERFKTSLLDRHSKS